MCFRLAITMFCMPWLFSCAEELTNVEVLQELGELNSCQTEADCQTIGVGCGTTLVNGENLQEARNIVERLSNAPDACATDCVLVDIQCNDQACEFADPPAGLATESEEIPCISGPVF